MQVVSESHESNVGVCTARALHWRLLSQISQDPLPPFFTCRGSLLNFPSLLVSESILYPSGKNPVDPGRFLTKRVQSNKHIVLIEPSSKVVGALRTLSPYLHKISLVPSTHLITTPLEHNPSHVCSHPSSHDLMPLANTKYVGGQIEFTLYC